MNYICSEILPHVLSCSFYSNYRCLSPVCARPSVRAARGGALRAAAVRGGRRRRAHLLHAPTVRRKYARK